MASLGSGDIGQTVGSKDGQALAVGQLLALSIGKDGFALGAVPVLGAAILVAGSLNSRDIGQLAVGSDLQVPAVGQLLALGIGEDSFALGAVPVLGAAGNMAGLNSGNINQLGVSKNGQAQVVGHVSAFSIGVVHLAVGAEPVFLHTVGMASLNSLHVDQLRVGRNGQAHAVGDLGGLGIGVDNVTHIAVPVLLDAVNMAGLNGFIVVQLVAAGAGGLRRGSFLGSRLGNGNGEGDVPLMAVHNGNNRTVVVTTVHLNFNSAVSIGVGVDNAINSNGGQGNCLFHCAEDQTGLTDHALGVIDKANGVTGSNRQLEDILALNGDGIFLGSGAGLGGNIDLTGGIIPGRIGLGKDMDQDGLILLSTVSNDGVALGCQQLVPALVDDDFVIELTGGRGLNEQDLTGLQFKCIPVAILVTLSQLGVHHPVANVGIPLDLSRVLFGSNFSGGGSTDSDGHCGGTHGILIADTEGNAVALGSIGAIVLRTDTHTGHGVVNACPAINVGHRNGCPTDRSGEVDNFAGIKIQGSGQIGDGFTNNGIHHIACTGSECSGDHQTCDQKQTQNQGQ